MLADLEPRVAAIEERMRRLVRVGRVVARYPEEAKVRVEFRDQDRVVTYKLPVVAPRPCPSPCPPGCCLPHIYRLPEIGDQVLCVFFPHGPEQGFVVGVFPIKEFLCPG